MSFSGCTVGPKTEQKVVLVKTRNEQGQAVTVGTVAENVIVPLLCRDDKGELFIFKQDIGGWDVVNPNAAEIRKKKEDFKKQYEELKKTLNPVPDWLNPVFPVVKHVGVNDRVKISDYLVWDYYHE